MRPGPSIIRKCSACGKLIEQPTAASCNSFGTQYWTDGNIKAPFVPDTSELVKCGHCATPVWLYEQKKVGKIEQPWENRRISGNIFLRLKEILLAALSKYLPMIFKNDSGNDVLRYCNLSAEDYLSFLANGAFEKRKERYLRLQAWWEGNNIRRQGFDEDEETSTAPADIKKTITNDAPPFSEDEIANLRAFAKMLNESDEDDRLMKAEIMRELGNYDEAMKLLSKPFNRKLSYAAKIIKKLVEQKNPFVQEY